MSELYEDNLDQLLESYNLGYLSAVQKKDLRRRVQSRLCVDQLSAEVIDELSLLQRILERLGHANMPLQDLIQLNEKVKSKVMEYYYAAYEAEMTELKQREGELRKEQYLLLSYLYLSENGIASKSPHGDHSAIAALNQTEGVEQRSHGDYELKSSQLEGSLFNNGTLGNSIRVRDRYYTQLPDGYPGYAEVLHVSKNPLIESIVYNQLVSYCAAHNKDIGSFRRQRRDLLVSPPRESGYYLQTIGRKYSFGRGGRQQRGVREP